MTLAESTDAALRITSLVRCNGRMTPTLNLGNALCVAKQEAQYDNLATFWRGKGFLNFVVDKNQ
jgi:hypothetical protein